MTVELIEYPTELDWLGVKQRALVTVGKEASKAPDSEWRRKILTARHSPIRYLRFSFRITGIPSWVSVHLARHVHAQPYIKSQRNDRQCVYDRNAARQDAPVNMIYDVNAEELMTIANKRLCMQASPETRKVVENMCVLASQAVPEIESLLVPQCVRNGGRCDEMKPCGMRENIEKLRSRYPDGFDPERSIDRETV